jgi:hypothetical protein
MRFSQINIRMRDMDMLRHRYKVGDVLQHRCLKGSVLDCIFSQAHTRIEIADEVLNTELIVGSWQIVDVKANHGRGQRFLRSDQRTKFICDQERRTELWYVRNLNFQVGAVSVSTVDTFVLAWMELQQNLVEYAVGKYDMPTAKSIIRSFQRELKGRVSQPDATMFVKSLRLSRIVIDVDFSRTTNLGMDFFNGIPKDTEVKLQGESALSVPQIQQMDILGDGDSILQRILDVYTPSLKKQVDQRMVGLGLDNFENYMSNWFSYKNEILEQKKAELSFVKSSLSNRQIIDKAFRNIRRQNCSSADAFDKTLWQLVYDWDTNHTALEARRCIAIGIINRSSKPVS